MGEALVFGASGQIGRPLLTRLAREGWRVCAVSRAAHADTAEVRWLRGGFDAVDGLPHAPDAIFSCGPLDLFARWYAASGVSTGRVIAFGSTSVHVKRDSIDASERDIAARLREGEDRVRATALACGAVATVLRPTLVYGAGRDHTLTRIAALARRWGRFVLPRGACGLRQPVHVEDLADAASAAVRADARGAFDLPGGETLPYREMVARVLAALDPPARLHDVPAPVFAAAVGVAHACGRLGGFGEGALARLREDLVFDAAPARAAFGYAPRAFAPDATMFTVPFTGD